MWRAPAGVRRAAPQPRLAGAAIAIAFLSTVAVFGSVGLSGPSVVVAPSRASAPVAALQAASATLSDGDGPAAGAAAFCSIGSNRAGTCVAGPPLGRAGSGGQNWTHLTGVGGPSSRWIAMMAYDPVDGYLVLFGGLQFNGQTGTTSLSDTWTYANGVWTNITLDQASSPSNRYASVFVWDAKDGYLLLFGGRQYSTSTIDNDTWSFVHGLWSQLSPTTSPAPRWRAAYAYDPVDGYVLMFGGSQTAAGTNTNDTWTFAGGNWTNITLSTTGHPLPRYRGDMAWDVGDGYAVLFGGCTNPASGITVCATNDTWTYTNHSWTNRTSTLATRPPARIYSMMTWDSEYPGVLLFGGGITATSGSFNDTWVFQSGAWRSVATKPAPASRGYNALADDPADHYVLLFGGYDYTTFYNDTWAFGASPVTAFHAQPTEIDRGQSTSFNLTAWPTGRVYTYYYTGLPAGCTRANASLLACTPSQVGSYVVNGTVNTTRGVSVTRNLTLVVSAPPSITAYTAVPDVLTERTDLNFTVTATGGTPPLSYHYAGLPFGCVTANVSQLTCKPAVYGWFNVTANVTDVLGGWNASKLAIHVNPQAALAGLSVSRVASDVGQHVSFSANVSGGTRPLSFGWSGLPAAGCSAETGPVVNCTVGTAGGFIAKVNVTDADGVAASGSPLSATYTVNTDPTVVGFHADPASVDVGVPVDLEFNATNGTPTYSYVWKNLPTGCALSGTGGACRPGASGTYTVEVTLTDAAGFEVNATTQLVVVDPPSVASVTVAPALIDVGQKINVSVAVSAGTAPFTYAYSGVPPGCTAPHAASFGCRVTTAGPYTLSVTVTDKFGLTGQGVSTLSVAPDPVLTQFNASPSVVTVGSAFSFTSSVSGGTGAFTYVYAGLPAPCQSSNESSLSCIPSATGTFNVTLTATDALGSSANRTTSVTVQAKPAAPPSTGGGLTSTLASPYVLLAIVVAVAAIVAGILLARRRGRAPPAEAEPEPEPVEAEPQPAEWEETPPS